MEMMELKDGCCKFCGQMSKVKVGKDIEYTQAQLDEITSMQCNCQEAEKYREKVNGIKAGRRAVRRNFKGMDAMVRIGCAAVEYIYAQDIDKVTIKAGSLTGIISLADGGVRTTLKRLSQQDDDGILYPGEEDEEDGEDDE